MMKPSLTILILVAVGLFSCSDDEGLPLTPELVSELRVYDLDNNGNSSDIRVDFEVLDNLNVSEYRVMLIPTSKINSFDESIASSVPETGYFSLFPEIFKSEYSIKRLPPSLPDVTSAPIQNNREYVAAVLVLGTGNQQLSAFSAPFKLKEQGIYTGTYWRKYDLNCTKMTEVEWNSPFWVASGGGRYLN